MFNNNSVVGIPKIIHQTWKTCDVPEKWKQSPIAWKCHHPGWSYKLWTDADNRELISTKYSWFLPIYDCYKYPIQRADAVRYFILYEYGGIYSDLDLYPIKPVDEYVSGDVESYFTFSGNYNCFTNSFMASKKGAKIWEYVFEKLRCNDLPWWAKCSKHFEIMMSTGPMMLDSVINDYLCATVGLLPKGFRIYEVDECVDFNCLKPGTVLLPLEGKSWCGADSYVLNFINQNKTELAVLCVVLIIIIIVLLGVFMFKYFEIKNRIKKYCKGRTSEICESC